MKKEKLSDLSSEELSRRFSRFVWNALVVMLIPLILMFGILAVIGGGNLGFALPFIVTILLAFGFRALANHRGG